MNIKRFAGAVISVYFTNQLTEFLIHGVILNSKYIELMHIWRPDMMSKMWIMRITSFILSVLFVYIFTKGYENKGILEGIRYGILMGLFMNVIGMFNQYAVYPVPLTLSLQWFCFAMIQFVIYGMITALIYKPK